MKLLFIVPIALLVLLGVALFNKPQEVESEPIPFKIGEGLSSDKLWSLVQNWRSASGLQPYIKDQRLCQIAEDRVIDGSDNHAGLYRKYSNYPYPLSENSTGAFTEREALDRWLKSKPHREALESNYKYSCIATDRFYTVQIFSNFLTN